MSWEFNFIQKTKAKTKTKNNLVHIQPNLKMLFHLWSKITKCGRLEFITQNHPISILKIYIRKLVLSIKKDPQSNSACKK